MKKKVVASVGRWWKVDTVPMVVIDAEREKGVRFQNWRRYVPTPK